LATLNDPQFVEAAKMLAQAALNEGGETFDGRLDVMAMRLLARPMRAEEARVVHDVYAELLSFYKQRTEDAKRLLSVGEWKTDPLLDKSDLAAWTMVANQLMNLDEVLNK
jgi:hypothetical protein